MSDCGRARSSPLRTALRITATGHRARTAASSKVRTCGMPEGIRSIGLRRLLPVKVCDGSDNFNEMITAGTNVPAACERERHDELRRAELPAEPASARTGAADEGLSEVQRPDSHRRSVLPAMRRGLYGQARQV